MKVILEEINMYVIRHTHMHKHIHTCTNTPYWYSFLGEP